MNEENEESVKAGRYTRRQNCKLMVSQPLTHRHI